MLERNRIINWLYPRNLVRPRPRAKVKDKVTVSNRLDMSVYSGDRIWEPRWLLLYFKYNNLIWLDMARWDKIISIHIIVLSITYLFICYNRGDFVVLSQCTSVTSFIYWTLLLELSIWKPIISELYSNLHWFSHQTRILWNIINIWKSFLLSCSMRNVLSQAKTVDWSYQAVFAPHTRQRSSSTTTRASTRAVTHTCLSGSEKKRPSDQQLPSRLHEWNTCGNTSKDFVY